MKEPVLEKAEPTCVRTEHIQGALGAGQRIPGSCNHGDKDVSSSSSSALTQLRLALSLMKMQ